MALTLLSTEAWLGHAKKAQLAHALRALAPGLGQAARLLQTGTTQQPPARCLLLPLSSLAPFWGWMMHFFH